MSRQWYIHKDGQQQGPFSWEGLWQMAQAGQVASEDLVWCQGMAAWSPAAQISGLFTSSWYVAQGGIRGGPLSWKELYAQARQGKLRPEDLVWSQGMADWQQASQIPGLLVSEPEGMADREKRVSLLTIARAETSVMLFGGRGGQWQEHTPEQPIRTLREEQVKERVLAELTRAVDNNAKLHACLTVEEAVAFKAVATLTWFLWQKIPEGAFCTAAEIRGWLEAGEHVQAMLLLGGDLRVATGEHDIGRGLAGLARHGLIDLWDGQLARLTEGGRSLGRFLVSPLRVHMLFITDKIKEQVHCAELGFIAHGTELVLTRPWQEQVLLWSLDKNNTSQIVDLVWQSGNRARALAELDQILEGGIH